MGSCYSSSSNHLQPPPTANVISATGDLHRFHTPITVSDALLHLTQMSSSSSSHVKNYSLSNSDRLSYDEVIPVMGSQEELVCGQIYFVFPNSKLGSRLSASDMAALAVKASLALSKNSKSNNKSPVNTRRMQTKISPHIESEQNTINRNDDYYNNATLKSGGIDIARKPAGPNSFKKLRRNSSKRAKMTVRSFRLRLSTIQEDSESQSL